MHPLQGTWIANVEASRRDPNHQFQRATMRFNVDGSRVSLTYGGINASGHQEHGTQVFEADGKEHEIPQAAGVVAISTLTSRALHTLGKKAGQDVGRAVYEVSEDGGSLTATVSGVDAQGNSFDQVILFDRDTKLQS